MKRAADAFVLPLRCSVPAPSDRTAISLAEGLAVISRSGREIAVSAAEEEVLQSGPILAGSAWKPTVDVYARETLLAYQPQTVVDTRSFPVAEQNSFSLGVRVRQLLYDFGRADEAVRAAVLDVDAKKLETSLARNRSALRFILAYIRLLRAEKLLALQEQEVTRYQAHRDDTRALLEEGAITENDLLQAEVRLSDAVQRRLQAENLRALAAAQANSLLQRPLALPVDTQEISGPAGRWCREQPGRGARGGGARAPRTQGDPDAAGLDRGAPRRGAQGVLPEALRRRRVRFRPERVHGARGELVAPGRRRFQHLLRRRHRGKTSPEGAGALPDRARCASSCSTPCSSRCRRGSSPCRPPDPG